MSTSTPLREILTETKDRADLGEREAALVVHRQEAGPIYPEGGWAFFVYLDVLAHLQKMTK